MRFAIRSDIPLSGGLGTSAAAYVAGLAAADALNGGGADLLDAGRAARRASRQRRGGAAGRLRGLRGRRPPTRLDPPAGLEAVLVVPSRAVRTAKARAALPAEVPMSRGRVQHRPRLAARRSAWPAATSTSSRAGSATALHQPRRASLVSAVDGAGRAGRRARRAGRDDLGRRPLGAGLDAVGGRGRGRRRACAAESAGWAQVLRLPFAENGAEVRL